VPARSRPLQETSTWALCQHGEDLGSHMVNHYVLAPCVVRAKCSLSTCRSEKNEKDCYLFSMPLKLGRCREREKIDWQESRVVPAEGEK